MLDRKTRIWLWIDFEDEQYSGYSTSDFDLLVNEYDFLSLVERPGLLRANLGWLLELAMPKNEKTGKSVLRLPLEKRAELAFREAVDEVISEHARLGLLLYIGQNGKVVKLSPKKVRVLSRSTHRKPLS